MEPLVETGKTAATDGGAPEGLEVAALEELGALAPEWDRLATETGAPPFARPGWIGAWYSAFGQGRPHLIAVRRDGELVAVLPLRRRGSRLFSCSSVHSPRFDCVATDRDAALCALQAALGECSALTLARLSAASPLAELVRDPSIGAMARRQVLRTTPAPCFEPPIGPEEIEETFGQRKKHRRRIANEEGGFSFEMAPPPEGLDEALDDLFRLEAAGWKSRTGTAILLNDAISRFYKEVAAWAAATGQLRLSFLRVGEHRLAGAIAVVDDSHLYALKIGHDPEYSRWAPGTLLVLDEMWRALSAGLSFEHGGGVNKLKETFSNGARRIEDVALFPRTLRGFLAALEPRRPQRGDRGRARQRGRAKRPRPRPRASQGRVAPGRRLGSPRPSVSTPTQRRSEGPEGSDSAGGRDMPGGGTKARAVLSITLARVLSVLLGLGREVLASAYFGTSAQFSAFAIAFQVPTAAQVLIGQGAISSALLPLLVEYDEEGNRVGFAAIVSRLLLLITAALTALSVIFIVIAPPLFELFLGSGFSAHIRTLTINLSQLLFPVVILLGAQSISVAVLNSRNRFALAAYAPAVWNVAVVVVLVLLHPAFSGDRAIYAYAIAVLVGSVAQLLWLIPGLTMVRWKAAWGGAVNHAISRRVLIRVVPVAFVAAAWQGDLIVNLIVGSSVGESVPRAIQAAQRLSTVGSGLVSVAIATVAFPAFRRHALRGERSSLGGLIERSMRMNVTLLVPVAALVVVLATPFTSVMYERGEFGPHSTALVSSALTWIIVGLPAGALWDLLTKVCFAADSYWPPAAIALVGLILDVVLSIVLAHLVGISGIALASSASFTVATAILGAYVQLKLVPYHLGRFLWSAARLAIAAAAAAAIATLAVGAVLPTETGDFSRNLATLIATGGVGFGLYLGAIRLLSPLDASLLWFQLGRAMPWHRESRG